MPDISMCAAKCPVSKQCVRHFKSGTQPNPYRQSWVAFEPKRKMGCSYFIQSRKEPTDG